MACQLCVRSTIRTHNCWKSCRKCSLNNKKVEEMLSHKMVPKYMKDFDMKTDSGSYRRDEKKCIASGEKALLNYHRVLENPPPPSNKSGYSTVLLYLLKRNELIPEEKEKCEVDEKLPDNAAITARAKNRKKETSL